MHRNLLHPTVTILALLAAILVTGSRPVRAELPAPTVTFLHVYPSGYAQNTINSVAINRNTLVTAGDYQFIAFYDRDSVRLGRRPLDSSDWSVFDTELRPHNITDDHDNVAIAIDGDGRLHMSWGMHNNPMNYAMSTNRVTGDEWGPTSISLERVAYWSGTAANNDSHVTYPEFYQAPGAEDMLFTYRQGGSGNGDQYFARYDTETGQWDKTRVIAGSADGVNAYPNRLVYDSAGKLLMTWTWRDTPAFQTNHNILYAESTDNGRSWSSQNGEAYTLPITKPQAQVIADIPQQSTLINQTSMTVDSQNRPLIATWYAPGAAEGDHTRQYMLHYFDGEEWQVSQITQRPPEEKQTDSTVRDLGRPIVLVDDKDRVLVVMRYKETGNRIVVAVSEDRKTWDFLELSDTDMGIWEPTYDPVLWERENKLHLFHQTMGTGQETSPVSVLEWDAKAYFATIPEPGGAGLVPLMCAGLRRRRGGGLLSDTPGLR